MKYIEIKFDFVLNKTLVEGCTAAAKVTLDGFLTNNQ